MSTLRLEIRIAEGMGRLLRMDDVHYGLLYHVRRVVGTSVDDALHFRPFHHRDGDSAVLVGARVERERLDRERGENTPLDRSLVRDSILEVDIGGLTAPVPGALLRVFVLLKPKTAAGFDREIGAVLCINQPAGHRLSCVGGGPEPYPIWIAPEWSGPKKLPSRPYVGDLAGYLTALDGLLAQSQRQPEARVIEGTAAVVSSPSARPGALRAPGAPQRKPGQTVSAPGKGTDADQPVASERPLQMLIAVLAILLLAALACLAAVILRSKASAAAAKEQTERIRHEAQLEQQRLNKELATARAETTLAQNEARDAAGATNTATEEMNTTQAKLAAALAGKAAAETLASEALAAKTAAEETLAQAQEAKLKSDEAAAQAGEKKAAAEAAKSVAESVTRAMLAERDDAVRRQRSAEEAAAQAETRRSAAAREAESARADALSARQALRNAEAAASTLDATPGTMEKPGGRRAQPRPGRDLPPVSAAQASALNALVDAARRRDLDRFNELRQSLRTQAPAGAMREDPERAEFSNRVEAQIQSAYAVGNPGSLSSVQDEVEQFLDTDGNYWNAYAQLALAQAQGTRFERERAQENAQRALLMNPSSGDAFFAWGIAATSRGENAVADGAFCALLIVGHTELTRQLIHGPRRAGAGDSSLRTAVMRAADTCAPPTRQVIGRKRN